ASRYCFTGKDAIAALIKSTLPYTAASCIAVCSFTGVPPNIPPSIPFVGGCELPKGNPAVAWLRDSKAATARRNSTTAPQPDPPAPSVAQQPTKPAQTDPPG